MADFVFDFDDQLVYDKNNNVVMNMKTELLAEPLRFKPMLLGDSKSQDFFENS